MGFTFQSGGFTSLIQRVQAASQYIPAMMEASMKDTADNTVSLLHDNAPFDPAPDNGQIPGEEGHLRDSFYADPIQAGGAHVTALVRTNEPIKFGYVVNGTDTPIVPVEKQALWWPDAPHPMPWVHGQAGNDFVGRLVDLVGEAGVQSLEIGLQQIVVILEGG